MNNDHLCSNTVATQNHDVEDAPDFTEDEKRDEAKLILSELLIANVTETFDILTKDHDDLGLLMSSVRRAVLLDEHLMNTLITRTMSKYEEEIQITLEQTDE